MFVTLEGIVIVDNTEVVSFIKNAPVPITGSPLVNTTWVREEQRKNGAMPIAIHS